MKRRGYLPAAAVGIAIVAIVIGIATVAALGDSQPPAPGGIRLVAEDGNVTEISPIIAERSGDPRLLDSQGRWTLEDLGYSDLTLPCRERLEAIVVDYILPEDAAQGPDKWYVLNCQIDIQFGEASEKGEVEVSASTNGAPGGMVHFQTESFDSYAVARWMESGIEYQVTSSEVAHLSYSIYLRDADMAWAGVKPGRNALAFRLAQYDGAEVKALRVSSSTSVEVTTVPPPGYKVLFAADLPKLSAEDESRAVSIAMSDPTTQQVLQGKVYDIEYVGPCEWPFSAGNARLDLVFKIPHQIQLDWPWPPVPIRDEPMSGNLWVRRMTIAIDLQKGTVTGVSPCGQLLPPANAAPNPQIPTLTEEEKSRAKQLALAEPEIQALLSGKTYAVGCRCGDSHPDSRIGVWHDESLQKLGACLEICFDKAYDIEYADSQYMARSLFVLVDLNEGKVVHIMPGSEEGLL